MIRDWIVRGLIVVVPLVIVVLRWLGKRGAAVQGQLDGSGLFGPAPKHCCCDCRWLERAECVDCDMEMFSEWEPRV